MTLQSTVHQYLKAAASSGVSWPLPPDWDERRLEEVVSGVPRPAAAWRKAATPDFNAIRRQLQTHRNLTLQLTWEEYREDHHDGYSYSRYVAAVFMLRSESSRWVGALSAALCSNITGRPPALQAFQEGHQRRQIGASRRSLRQALDVDAC